jgi:hypothetical protein
MEDKMSVGTTVVAALSNGARSSLYFVKHDDAPDVVNVAIHSVVGTTDVASG